MSLGCTGETLVLELDAETSLREAGRRVDVIIDGGDGPARFAVTPDAWPLRGQVVPNAAPFVLTAHLRDASGAILATQRLRTRFEGTLRLMFSESCGDSCSARETCVAGRCEGACLAEGAQSPPPWTSCTPTEPPPEPDYFVTVDGSESADGRTESTAWSLPHAFATAQAGDVVYVKAGNYGALVLRTSHNGTAEAPIRFIGYRQTPGDVVSTEFSTYSLEDFNADATVMNGADMPLLENDRGPNNDPDPDDRALTINHDYVHVENFKLQYYDYGVFVRSDDDNRVAGVSLINIVANEMGNWDVNNGDWGEPTTRPEPEGNFNGYGLSIGDSTGTVLRNCTSFNGGRANFEVVSSDHVDIDYIRSYATKPGNGTDFNFLFYATTNSTFHHYESFRDAAVPQVNTALQVSCGADNNVFEDIYTENLRIVVRDHSNDNVFRNVESQGSGEPFQAEFTLTTNVNRNRIYNYRANNSGGINFRGGNDDCDGGTEYGTGDDNVFINPVITNVVVWHKAAIDFGFQTGNESAGTNYIIGGTFDGAPYLIKIDRPNDMLYLVNCTFSNITSGFAGSREEEGFIPNITYDHVNFFDVPFALPSGTNVTNHDPLSNADHSLSPASPLRDIGVDASTYESTSNVDFAGIPRPVGAGWDIGAYEY